MLTLADVRRLLGDRLRGEPARASFGTGAITVCSLLPLRSVPHRVVCLLGLDQDAFPRPSADGDDLLVQQSDVGDRDPRAEVRQLLLEAVLAAQDHLVITHSAVDVRTNQTVPAATVLDELWDCITSTVVGPPEKIADHVRVAHPRQAFAPSNFADPPRSFDPVALAGARALVGREAHHLASGPAVTGPLPPLDLEVVDLADLRAFLRHPVKAFFQRRLEVYLHRETDPPADTLPIRLEPLQNWGLGDGLLSAERTGLDRERWLGIERARGALPPASLGVEVVEAAEATVDGIIAAADELGLPIAADAHWPVDVTVGGGRVVGSVAGCGGADLPGPVACTFSRAKPSHRLMLWLDLVALTATRPEVVWRAVGLGRGSTAAKPVRHVLTLAGDDASERGETALAALGQIVDLYREGMIQPLPLFDKTSDELARGNPGRASGAWSRSPFGEGHDEYHRLAFGECSFAEIQRGRVAGRTTLEWARRLWDVVEASLAPEPESSTSARPTRSRSR